MEVHSQKALVATLSDEPEPETERVFLLKPHKASLIKSRGDADSVVLLTIAERPVCKN